MRTTVIRRSALIVGIGTAVGVGLVAISVGPMQSERAQSRALVEPIELSRRDLGPGVELVEASMLRQGEHAGRLVGLYLEPGRIRPEIAINKESSSLVELFPEAFLIVNAGFFTPERRATGLLVTGGRVLSPFVAEGGPAGSGVLVLDSGALSLLPREKVLGRSFAGVPLAIQAGPRIIEPDGTFGIRSDDGDRANRTVIGRDRRGRLVVLVLIGPAGANSGPTLFETQRLLGHEGVGRLADDLALAFALNLDGGTSTGLVLRDPKTPLHFPEASPVHSVLAFWKSPP